MLKSTGWGGLGAGLAEYFPHVVL